jgi:hypothetical protein
MADETTPVAPAESPASRPAAKLPLVAAPESARPFPSPAVPIPGAVEALRWGLASAWSSRRIVVLIAACNLALALAVIYPMFGPLDASISHHPDAARMGREFDYRWWTDWTVDQASVVTSSVNLLGAASLAMLLASAFFAGGLLEALRSGPRHPLTFEPLPDPFYRGATPEWRAAAPGPASLQIFLRESARHFPIFLLLLALSLPLYWVVHRLLNVAAVIGLDGLLEGIRDERMGLLLTLARAVLFVGAFQLVTVLFEYARAQAVLRPGASLIDLVGLPLAVARSHPAAFLGIEAGALLLQLGAMLAFIPIDRLLGRWSPASATLGFAASQVFLFTRLLIRSGAQGAQLRLAQAWLAKKI